MQKTRQDLHIVFVGDRDRGVRLTRDIKTYDWTIKVVTEMMPALAEYIFYTPDLVILDNFPTSNLAKSVYFHLRSIDAGPFLALNDAPHALMFLHVNTLPFIKMLKRDPEPPQLMEAIFTLVEDYRNGHGRQAGRRCERRNEMSPDDVWEEKGNVIHLRACPAKGPVK